MGNFWRAPQLAQLASQRVNLGLQGGQADCVLQFRLERRSEYCHLLPLPSVNQRLSYVAYRTQERRLGIHLLTALTVGDGSKKDAGLAPAPTGPARTSMTGP